MKRRLPSAIIVASVCAFCLGLGPRPQDHCKFSIAPVFTGDDERVLQFQIESAEPTPYRFMTVGQHSGGELPGQTERLSSQIPECHGTAWLIVSQIVPPDGEHAYIKTILRSNGSTVSRTEVVPRSSSFAECVVVLESPATTSQPMDTPLKIGSVAGHEIWLMVGPASETWRPNQSVEATADPSRRRP